jgi:enolase-phosphatase E1
MRISSDIQHVLLDIEGTTCPVTFVSQVLFPYASAELLPYLQRHHSDPSIRSLLAEVHSAWRNDSSPEAIALAKGVNRLSDNGQWVDQTELAPEEACLYLNWLINQDRKLTALKDLQGLIWEEGYQQGKLIAPLFADVPAALQLWHSKGIALSVYSSGSIHAQKLLYAHSNAGNLSHLFSHWFDTRTGAKNQPASYANISVVLQAKPAQVLFVSDAPAELSAAKRAGMSVLFSRRPGNPHHHAEDCPTIETFETLEL